MRCRTGRGVVLFSSQAFRIPSAVKISPVPVPSQGGAFHVRVWRPAGGARIADRRGVFFAATSNIFHSDISEFPFPINAGTKRKDVGMALEISGFSAAS